MERLFRRPRLGALFFNSTDPSLRIRVTSLSFRRPLVDSRLRRDALLSSYHCYDLHSAAIALPFEPTRDPRTSRRRPFGAAAPACGERQIAVTAAMIARADQMNRCCAGVAERKLCIGSSLNVRLSHEGGVTFRGTMFQALGTLPSPRLSAKA